MRKLRSSHRKAEQQQNRYHRAGVHTAENIVGSKGAYLEAGSVAEWWNVNGLSGRTVNGDW